MAGQRSVAWPLSGVAIALVAYATLYPLSGWHWPDPQVFSWVLPKLGHEAATDLAGNILGYVPLGFILCLAHLRVARGALLAGLLGLMMAPLQLVVSICMLLGIGIGALFPLSLVVAQDHLDDPRQTGDLLAFVQGGGYLIAATAPFLAGLLRQYTDDLRLSWLTMAAATVVLMVMAARFAPGSGRFQTRPILGL